MAAPRILTISLGARSRLSVLCLALLWAGSWLCVPAHTETHSGFRMLVSAFTQAAASGCSQHLLICWDCLNMKPSERLLQPSSGVRGQDPSAYAPQHLSCSQHIVCVCVCVCAPNLLFRTPEILTNVLFELMSLATCPSNFAVTQ